jgi:hypothetical protein
MATPTAFKGGRGIELSDGTSLAVSPTSKARIRYNSTLARFEQSTNGGLYVAMSLVPGVVTWTAATYQNSWVSFNASTHYVAEYYKDALGWVNVRGIIKTGASGTAVFTLPAGFRPTRELNIGIAVSAGHGVAVITTAGVVTVTAITGNASTFSSLDGIRFYAEQ